MIRSKTLSAKTLEFLRIINAPRKSIQANFVPTVDDRRNQYSHILSRFGTKLEAAENAVWSRNLNVVGRENHIIPCKVYYPHKVFSGTELKFPILLYAHGGGWTVGNINDYDIFIRKICAKAKVVCVNVEYRLAPEHVFPAGVNDVYDVFEHLISSACRLENVDVTRIAVAGDSAGGNLVAALCHTAKQNGSLNSIKLQALLCMVANDHKRALTSPSYKAFGKGYFLTKEMMEFFYKSYTDGLDINVDDIYKLAPLRSKSCAGLPPAYIALASHDPLFSEGLEYGKMLSQHGVPVKSEIFSGIHIFWMLGLAVGKVNEEAFLQSLAAQIRQALFDSSKL